MFRNSRAKVAGGGEQGMMGGVTPRTLSKVRACNSSWVQGRTPSKVTLTLCCQGRFFYDQLQARRQGEG